MKAATTAAAMNAKVIGIIKSLGCDNPKKSLMIWIYFWSKISSGEVITAKKGMTAPRLTISKKAERIMRMKSIPNCFLRLAFKCFHNLNIRLEEKKFIFRCSALTIIQ